MVTDPETLDRIELRRDPNTGKFVGYDPDSGDTFPIPIESLSTESIALDGVTPGWTIPSGTYKITAETSNQSTQNTSLTSLLTFNGKSVINIPDGMNLYAWFGTRITTDDAAETVTARPRVFSLTDEEWKDLPAIEVSHTGSTTSTHVNSGWTKITASIGDGEVLTAGEVRVKISTGTATATISETSNVITFAVVEQ